MEQWNEFKEKMDHEMSNVPISLLKEGYNLDDDKKGIKISIGFNALKAVDYIANNGSLAFVEFSDLYSQQNEIKKQIQTLKRSELEKSDKRKFIKKLGRTIQKELTDKYKDTHFIVSQMQKQKFCLKLDGQYRENETLKKYWIIVAPFHDSIADENKVEIARFIDSLESTVSRCLPPIWNVRVSIISINNFAMPVPR